jgi:acetoin utilization deacetylase AcuC-like enzyme/GNAT superfamily N-acetyltransferase
MFRVRKILDNTSSANMGAIRQVLDILGLQFPSARGEEFARLQQQLNDPLKYKYRSILFVAETGAGKVRGFAMLLHMPDIGIAHLELIATAPGRTGGGVGGALYEFIREECLLLRVKALFLECLVDDPLLIYDEALLKKNAARLKFYERYGVYPIINNLYPDPIQPGDQDLYFLMLDNLGRHVGISRRLAQKVVRAILERRYGHIMTADQINRVVNSFSDDPVKLRPSRYTRKREKIGVSFKTRESIILVVNEGHQIHHVKDRGYVEAPVRLSVILESLGKTGLFKRIVPKHAGERLIKQVHLPAYVDYLKAACAQLEPGKSIYPIIFPMRNISRPPADVELQLGYYCHDTFTPLNSNAYLAACGAVDCAVTAANSILDGAHLAYALVRPPGHHAERRAFGGFCYFNSAAIAGHHFSAYGRVAILDIDFHHGNGTQDIFYDRSDVLTVSIHGDPHFAYPHFSGFRDERGDKAGAGFNINYPLPEHSTPEQYRKTLKTALKSIIDFNPAYLIVCLGLDTAKSDPTGSWRHTGADFFRIGHMIGELRIQTLVVQEGGYRTRTLGSNARNFFEGLWSGFSGEAPDDKRLSQ